MSADGASSRDVGTFELGILGGGQLARMLLEAAQAIGVRTCVLSASPDDPAARLAASGAGTWIQEDAPGVRRDFLSRCQAVTFESEFVDSDALRLDAKGLATRFVPGLDAIGRLQDKLTQKDALTRLGIPTAEYEVMGQAEEPGEFFARASLRFAGDGFVLKWSRLGYDGKGVHLVDAAAAADPHSARGAGFSEFCAGARSRGARVYAERRIRYARELAIAVCRAPGGGVATYPLMISEQAQGVCLRVLGPATALGVSPALEMLARDYARLLGEGEDIGGVFALELFETESGQLLVNEIAPRVHNSAHCTQDAAITSQFENHVRAATGRLLGSAGTRMDAPFFAMLNLLGPPGAQGPIPADLLLPPDAELASLGVFAHRYGKTETRPGRKLGHLNTRAGSRGELDARLAQLEEVRAAWAKSVLQAVSGRDKEGSQ